MFHDRNIIYFIECANIDEDSVVRVIIEFFPNFAYSTINTVSVCTIYANSQAVNDWYNLQYRGNEKKWSTAGNCILHEINKISCCYPLWYNFLLFRTDYLFREANFSANYYLIFSTLVMNMLKVHEWGHFLLFYQPNTNCFSPMHGDLQTCRRPWYCVFSADHSHMSTR